jgi:hypothetical protein
VPPFSWDFDVPRPGLLSLASLMHGLHEPERVGGRIVLAFCWSRTIALVNSQRRTAQMKNEELLPGPSHNGWYTVACCLACRSPLCKGG